MQSSTHIERNQKPIVARSAANAFLRPKHSSYNVTQVAWKRRSPPRVFGFTKAQVLDTLMRSNARICASFAALSIPTFGYMMYRYHYVLKPRKLEFDKQKEEELLAEGAFKNS